MTPALTLYAARDASDAAYAAYRDAADAAFAAYTAADTDRNAAYAAYLTALAAQEQEKNND